MIKVGVKNNTGSATEFGMMNDHGIIFFENGTISSVSAEASKRGPIFVVVEEKKEEKGPEAPTPAQSEPPKKNKKKG